MDLLIQDWLGWLLLGGGAAIAFAFVRTHPEMLMPRCPICFEHMEPSEASRPILRLGGWQLGWRLHVCTQCLNRRALLTWTRSEPPN